jgi:hypothetical protein
MTARNGRVGKPSWIVLAFGAGACWYAYEHWNTPAPKAAAAPVTRTVVVHQVVTKVVHAAAHSPVSGTDIVLMVIASLVVVLVLGLNRRA